MGGSPPQERCLESLQARARADRPALFAALLRAAGDERAVDALGGAICEAACVETGDDGRPAKQGAAAAAAAAAAEAVLLEELVVDVLRLHGADAEEGMRAAAAEIALRLVQAAAALAARGVVRRSVPPMLFQVVLLTADAEVLCGQCQDRVVQCFRAFRAAGTAEQPRGKLALTKAVVLFLRRTVVRVNPAVSGRVRKELMSTVPAWDNSVINKFGRCDVENVVEYDRGWSAVVEVDKGGGGGGGASGASGGDGGAARVDRATYGSVWGMQRFLSNPALCEEETGCAAFLRAVEAVQAALDGARLLPNDLAGGAGGAARRYLTAPELLDLQLKDVHFRRNIVLQILLALHALRHRWREREDAPPTPTGGAGGGGGAEDGESVAPWKAALFSAGGKGKGNDLIAAAERLLARMDEEADAGGGSQELRLSRFVESALSREEVWIDWKGTLRRKPGATQPRSTNPSILQKRRHGMMDPSEEKDPQTDCLRLRKAICVRDRKSFSDYDGPHLHREDGRYDSLSSRPVRYFDKEGREGSWSRMDKEERRRLLREDISEESAKDVFLRDLKQDLEDDPEMEEEYRKCNNPAYVWRALRELGSHDLERMLDVADVSAQTSGRSEFDVFDIRRAFEERQVKPSPGSKPSTPQSPSVADKPKQDKPSSAAPVQPINGVAGEAKTASGDDSQKELGRADSTPDGEGPANVAAKPKAVVAAPTAGEIAPKSANPAPKIPSPTTKAPSPSAMTDDPAPKTVDVDPVSKMDGVPTSGDGTPGSAPKDADLPPTKQSAAPANTKPSPQNAKSEIPIDTEMSGPDALASSSKVVEMQVEAGGGKLQSSGPGVPSDFTGKTSVQTGTEVDGGDGMLSAEGKGSSTPKSTSAAES